MRMETSELSILHLDISQKSTMDWFTWLSKTKLDPSLIYDYGVIFSRNQLQLEDATYFDHEFLQSMGVSIAKHRLEILKLVKKENGGRPNKFSGVVKKCLKKCASMLVFREDTAVKDMQVPEKPKWHQENWRGALVRKQGIEERSEEKPVHKTRTIALSGPIDGRMYEKMANPNKVLKLSGPLDGRMHERLAYANRSPIMPRPLDGRDSAKSPRLSRPESPRMMFGSKSPRPIRPESPKAFSQYNTAKVDLDYDDDQDHILWPTLFQDLKPT
ncbi:hypothetical protein L6164_014264 [Bauhinia variegata]|uniref:Uncharacterized protein n=1 Tax=Bauhinia variegata TaxID=167791 RepID=A0ACB9NHH8_BAUVA|nr:hypothetical protein L6164_014264 [Bauhinia variegata]